MEGKNIYIKNIIKGVVISFITTLILFLVLAVILSKTSISESVINPSIIVLSCISIFFGAGIASKKVKQKGIVIGAVIGLTYMILMYVISSILSQNFALNLYGIILFLASIFMGAVGGILGVNLD